MEYHIPRKGERYRHFKGKQYEILAVAAHTETSQQLVVYEGLYGEHPIYARPLDMFLSKVDLEKYPDSEQKERFRLEEESVISDTQTQKQSMILEFLDLDTKDEKIEYLQRHHMDITDSFLSSAAMSLDFAESKDTLELRYDDLMQYLKTLSRYENGRR